MAPEKKGFRRRLSEAFAKPTHRSTTPKEDAHRAHTYQRPREYTCRDSGVHQSLRSQAPRLFPSRASLAASADPQHGSALFTTLLAEVRRVIYAFAWRTGGHSHGIHVQFDSSTGYVRSFPCSLGHEESWVSTALDAEPNEGLGRAVQFSGSEWRVLRNRAERTHDSCDDDDVDGPRNAARWRTGGDALALWSPFLPVLLTCKRLYLESIDTIFQDLPLLFSLHAPTPAHAFFSQDPHPSTAYLHTVTLYADRFAIHDVGPTTRNRTHRAIPSPTGPDATQWKCVLSSLAALPALREVRISLRFDPLEDHDLRNVARWAGPALAAKMTVDLPRSEGLRVQCRECRAPPGKFIVPAGNAEGVGEDGDDCPAFGKVNWYVPLRYVVGREFFPPMPYVARDPSGDLCWYCSQWQRPDAWDDG